MRHALWLVPGGAARRRLAAVIGRLARAHGGPVFAPHVTLLGGIGGRGDEIPALVKRLAAATPRLALRFSGIGLGEARFRCIHLLVGTTPALKTARRRALALFPPPRRVADVAGTRGRFAPHLSLFYGRLPRGVKRRIAAGLGRLAGLRFAAAEIRLVRISSGVSSWRVVGRARLDRRRVRRPPVRRRGGSASRRALYSRT